MSAEVPGQQTNQQRCARCELMAVRAGWELREDTLEANQVDQLLSSVCNE